MLLLQELLQRLPGNDLDDAAEHVGGMAVAPQRAGLPRQRQPRDPLGKHLVVERLFEQIGLRIGLLDQLAADIAVGDARGVPQQIGDRHRPARRLALECRLAVAFALDADLHIGEGRNVGRHRIGEREAALLDQHHRRDAGDRLGHRIQREHGVGRHRRAGGDVAHADAFLIDRPAVLQDQHHRAGNLALRDLVVEEGGEPFEAGLRHGLRATAAAAWLGMRQGRRHQRATAAMARLSPIWLNMAAMVDSQNLPLARPCRLLEHDTICTASCSGYSLARR